MAEPDKAWVENPRVAPYVWSALVKWGGTGIDYMEVGRQYPGPAGTEMPLATVGFDYVPRTILRPDDVHTFVNSRAATILVRATPLRNNWPTFEHEIEPGDRLIWCRRVVIPFNSMGGAGEIPQYETMLFGRETAGGKVALMQIWPNAEFHEFDNYKDALARF
jgi:hypothetical protein